MSALDDLIAQITDENLRDRIQKEVHNLKRKTEFGLVFEQHTPEVTPLYGVPIKKNSHVTKKIGKPNELFRVVQVDGDNVICTADGKKFFSFARDELVCVAKFGEPIYPCLKKIDAVCNAPESDLWHTLIEAENYHALQLLRYICADRKVDCIYIDPPYNTGARDWKYNDNYVDASDGFRHSKWLAMMKRRLLLAKDILSDSGAIFISIDDNEQAALKLLCDEIFGRDNFVANISVIVNPSGRDYGGVARMHEYILVYQKSHALKINLIPDEDGKFKMFDGLGGFELRELRNRNVRFNVDNRPNLYYPFYIDTSSVDENGLYRISLEPEKNFVELYPMESQGVKTVWRWGKEKSAANLNVHIMAKKKKAGGYMIVEKYREEKKMARSVWAEKDFRNESGTLLLKEIFDGKVFDYPKPLELIKRILQMATDKNSLVVDFFAGSGTTMHAVNLLNAEDGGRRRCILVTNNEVGETEERRLKNLGYQPDSEEWQELGIARHVTWRRTVCSITGKNIHGEPLKGKYFGSEIAMADGFKANAIFFKLGFLDKNAVEFGMQFREILPLIWLKAGGCGACPTLDEKILPPMMILPENKFAVLLDEKYFLPFEEKILELGEIETVYIVTDSRDGYVAMIKNFLDRKTYQLYRDYLDNFKINLE